MTLYEKNKLSFVLFVLFIACLIVGGYYLINNKKDDSSNKEDTSIIKNVKIDKNKDYIYLSNNSCLSNSLQICYPTINININTEDAKEIMTKLNDQMANLDRNYSKISETNTEGLEILYYDDDIFSANVIDYNYYTSSKSISLIVTSYKYYATGDTENLNLDVYNFSVETGNILTNQEILKLYNIDEEKIIQKIEENENQSDLSLDIEKDCKMTIDDNDNLIVNYIVSNTESSYNNSITIYN